MPGSTMHKGVRAYSDLKYDRLFTRTRGWNGGDGVLTVGLPNGDVLWTFNDSFYGLPSLLLSCFQLEKGL